MAGSGRYFITGPVRESFRAPGIEWISLIFYRQERFGYLGFLTHSLGIIDTDALRTMHWNINYWNDEEIIAWKTAIVSN